MAEPAFLKDIAEYFAKYTKQRLRENEAARVWRPFRQPAGKES